MSQKCFVNRISRWIISSAQDAGSRIKIHILLLSIKMYFHNNLYLQLSPSFFIGNHALRRGRGRGRMGVWCPSAVFRVNSWQKKYTFVPIFKKPKALSPQRLRETMQTRTISLGICALAKVKSLQQVTCWLPIITLGVLCTSLLKWFIP